MAILVVEDEAAIRSLLVEVLGEDGWTVHTAVSAEDARPLLAQHPPQLLIVDHNLPGISGLAFCRQLRADPQTTTLPVVLMTAHRQLTLPDNDPATVLLRKPFTLPTLLDALAQARLAAH